jgi:hypothetical protein
MWKMHERDKKTFDILIVNFNGKDHLGGLGLDGMILLKWILKKAARILFGFNWLRIEFSTVIYFRFDKRRGFCRSSEQFSASQELSSLLELNICGK